MEEMAASSSRWRAALAFSFSAARFSAGAALSVAAFADIVFSLCLVVIAGRGGLVNGSLAVPLAVLGSFAVFRTGPPRFGAGTEWVVNDSVFNNLVIMLSFIAGGVGHPWGYPS